MRKLFLLPALLLATATPVRAAPLCAVVFEIELADGGIVRSVKVARIAPLGAETPPKEIPAAFVEAAREQFAKLYKGKKAGHFFTYLYFDPDQPTNADVDLTAPPQRAGAEGP